MVPTRTLALLVTLVAACGCTEAAIAAGLPLGPLTLSETRSTQALAPGATYTRIMRGTTTPDEVFVVDLGFTLDRAQAHATAADLRSRGYRAKLVEVDDHAPDSPQPGPAAYMVRVGHYEKAADAQAAAAQLTTQGFQKVHVDYTGDDGTSTGGPWLVHVLDVDPRRFKGTVAPVLATDVVPGRETVSSIDGRTDALAGINGGYFVIGDSDGTPGDLAGISMVGGDLVSEAVNGRTDLLLPHRNGRGAQVTQLSTVLSVRADDRSRRELDGRNRRPGLIRSCGGVGGDQPIERPLHDVTCTDPSELIQFTPAFGVATDPSSEIEAVLDARGRVLAHRPPGGPIPAGGSVLAGTGDGADWLRSHAQPGHTVHVRTRVASDGWPLEGEAQLGAVNGGPRLLRGGTPAIDAASEGFTHPEDPEFFYRFGIRRNPRTLAGITRSGHLLLVAVDGRAPGYSDGLSFAEEADVMRSLGASDAVNLDGGGSTAMALGATLVTRPSDATGERPVGDAITLLAPAARTPR